MGCLEAGHLEGGGDQVKSLGPLGKYGLIYIEVRKEEEIMIRNLKFHVLIIYSRLFHNA